MIKINKTIYLFLSSLFFCGSFFAFNNFILANNNVDHIVISEIQIGGETVYDEFIELYNPTDSEINLNDWDIKRKTKSGTESNVLNNIEGVIPSYGYFLIIPRANCGEDNNEKCYSGTVAADDEYTTDSFLAADNAVLLYDSNGNLTDKIGWGEASDFEGEAININPENNQSLERKTADNIIQDSDNNKNDFILQNNPNPRNANSVVGQNDSGQETEANDEGEDSDDISANNNNGDEIPPAPFVKGEEKIIITEFLPDPEDSDKDNEFIEIYNNDDKEIDLSGWILEDKTGSVKKFIIPTGTKMSAGEYQAFYSDETKITLNNSGDGVVLRDDENNIIDGTPISDAAAEERSYALDKNGNWIWTLRPTPGRENIIKEEEKIENKDSNQKNEINEADEKMELSSEASELSSIFYDFSDRIIISEIYPNSKGTDNRNGSYEWIELYNNSDRDVNLNGWLIDDILERGSKPYAIENEIIAAGGYKIFDAAFTKIALNNTGDEVNLLWPDGTVVDKIKYEKADEGLSYNLSDNDSWFWSAEITPAKKNAVANFAEDGKTEYGPQGELIYTEDEYFMDEEFVDGNIAEEYAIPNYIETNLADLKHFTKYTRVKIRGVVSTPPGTFSDRMFYIFGSGIQVYSHEAKIPRLDIGDEVEIVGRISEAGGEKRILLDNSEDIKIISRDNLVEPKIISTGGVNEATEGHLVTVEGRVARIKSDVFFLDDGSGEIKIYIKPPTRIEKPEIKIGDWMVITGQVSRTSAGYRILPRFPGDIKLSRVTGAAKAADNSSNQEGREDNKNDNFIFYAIIIIIGALVFVDWIKVRLIKGGKVK